MPRSFKNKSKKPLILAFDFDGVIHPYSGGYQGRGIFANPYPEASNSLHALKSLGYKILINTCRGENKLIKEYLLEHNIPFDWINEHPDITRPAFFDPNPHKVPADIYIDDRNLKFQGWSNIVNQVEDFTLWYDRPGSKYPHGNKIGFAASESSSLDLVSSHLRNNTIRFIELETDNAISKDKPDQAAKLSELKNLLEAMVNLLECS